MLGAGIEPALGSHLEHTVYKTVDASSYINPAVLKYYRKINYLQEKWLRRKELNLRRPDPKSGVLPAELLRKVGRSKIQTYSSYGKRFTVSRDSSTSPYALNYLTIKDQIKTPAFVRPGFKTNKVKNSAPWGVFSYLFVLYVCHVFI